MDNPNPSQDLFGQRPQYGTDSFSTRKRRPPNIHLHRRGHSERRAITTFTTLPRREVCQVHSLNHQQESQILFDTPPSIISSAQLFKRAPHWP